MAAEEIRMWEKQPSVAGESWPQVTGFGTTKSSGFSSVSSVYSMAKILVFFRVPLKGGMKGNPLRRRSCGRPPGRLVCADAISGVCYSCAITQLGRMQP